MLDVQCREPGCGGMQSSDNFLGLRVAGQNGASAMAQCFYRLHTVRIVGQQHQGRQPRFGVEGQQRGHRGVYLRLQYCHHDIRMQRLGLLGQHRWRGRASHHLNGRAGG